MVNGNLDQFGGATLDLDTATGPDVWRGEAFTIRVSFNVPFDSKECCTRNSNYENDVRLAPDNQFRFASAKVSSTKTRSGVEFYEREKSGVVDITLRRPVNTEGKSNKIVVVAGGPYGNGDPYHGTAPVVYSPPSPSELTPTAPPELPPGWSVKPHLGPNGFKIGPDQDLRYFREQGASRAGARAGLRLIEQIGAAIVTITNPSVTLIDISAGYGLHTVHAGSNARTAAKEWLSIRRAVDLCGFRLRQNTGRALLHGTSGKSFA